LTLHRRLAPRAGVVDDTNCFRFLRDNCCGVAAFHGAGTTVIYLDRPPDATPEAEGGNNR
jgi:hypothetical protein